MRALHVHSGNLYGGVETLLVTLARHRAAAPGLEPRFALCFEGRLAAELGAAGVEVADLGEARVRRPLSVRRARGRLRRLLAGDPVDVVLVHNVWALALFGPVVRRAGMPLVLWLHGPAGGRHWLERCAGRTPPDLVIANSRFTAGSVPALFPAAATTVVHPPVAAPRPAPGLLEAAAARRELATPDEAVVILQASRLEPWKGHEVLIEALGRLRELPRWVGWLAGGAQRPAERRYLAALEARAAGLGIADRLRFLGERSDVPRLLAAAEVFCHPNTAPEPFGVVLVEALYAGLPVVTTAFGGATEIVEQPELLLAPPPDPSELASRLRRLIEDPRRRRELGAGGPARAEEICAPERRIVDLERLLARTVAGARAA